MKKLFALALVVLGLAACQTDPSDLNVNFDGTTTVCLTLPEDAITRAGGSDSAATGLTNTTGEIVRFIMEIYDENGVKSAQRYVDYADEGTLSVTFPVQLVPGRDYTFVAWADMVDAKADVDKYYNTQDLKNITLNSEWNAMEETRDAFTDNCVITNYSGASTIELNLVRPFAKVRVVATDLPQVTNLHLEPTTATVTYNKPIPVSYNAFEQKVGTTTESKVHRKFALVGANDEKLYGDNSDAQMVLYADYIFANDEQGAVSFTIETFDQNDLLIKETTFNTDIAVKRNMLTTIKGDIMTTSNNITVKVENPDEFANDEHEIVVKEANSASELQQIINEAEEGEETVVNIGSNIDLGLGGIILSTRAEDPAYGILVSANKVITLDLCGKTLSMTKECSKSFSMIQNNGTLKIVDTKGGGKISFKDTGAGDPTFGWGSYTVRNYGGTLVVENGTIEHLGEQNTPSGAVHMYCAIDHYSGSTTINGGTISNQTYRSVRLWSGDMTINGGNFEGQLWLQSVNDTGNLTINGGTFAPRGGDGSSVFIENDKYVANLAVNGGFFNTKIGCSDATKEGVKGSIVGGTFTTAAKDNTKVELLADGYYFEADGENFKVISKEVAKVGENTYKTLLAAINAVEDGGTITIIDDITYNQYTRVHNSGTYYDGLLYDGDKSFTIDLNDKTITNDASVNDYLLFFRNNGEKANTITIKNGTLTAAPSAYAAIATASSNAQKITMNLEDIAINGNNSDGAVIKFRGGCELNIKAGTVITGENNYCGMEVVHSETIANIYDDVEFYQNGTSSYVGAIAGVSLGATMNVYGGKGVSAKCGLIVMNSGGTINVEGGEWTANSDGTPMNDNSGVLVSQFHNADYPSVLNVKGGTFRGGYNCYGNVAGKAFIKIYGGNFNANPVDPTNYVVDGYEVKEENGIYTVGVPQAQVDFEAAIAEGGNVTLTENVTLVSTVVVPEDKEVVLDLNGFAISVPKSATRSIYALNNKGKLTIKDSKGTGSISARGIYNGYDGVTDAEMIIDGGNFNSIDFDGGASIFTYGKLKVNGGNFVGGLCAINVRNGAECTISGGTFNEARLGSSSYMIQNNGGKLTIDNATVESGFGAVGCYSGTTVINDGSFLPSARKASTCHVVYVAGGADVTINGGTYKMDYAEDNVPDSGSAVASYYNGTLAINGGTFYAHFDNVSPVELSSGSSINGGKFLNHSGNPSNHTFITNYVAEGYELNANGEVVAK